MEYEDALLEFFGADVSDAKLYPLYFYFLILFLVGIIIWVTRQLENSRIGRAWKAIREDEIAAAAMGVPVVRMKLLAFAVGASFAAAVPAPVPSSAANSKRAAVRGDIVMCIVGVRIRSGNRRHDTRAHVLAPAAAARVRNRATCLGGLG